jgi:hypothetical protein
MKPPLALVLVPLRTVLALALLLMMLIQPAAYAKSGSPGDSSIVNHHSLAVVAADHSSVSSHDALQSEHTADREPGPLIDEEDGGRFGEACEVHCAPHHAVPASCPELARIPASCFHADLEDLLEAGEYASLIRPPRS